MFATHRMKQRDMVEIDTYLLNDWWSPDQCMNIFYRMLSKIYMNKWNRVYRIINVHGTKITMEKENVLNITLYKFIAN